MERLATNVSILNSVALVPDQKEVRLDQALKLAKSGFFLSAVVLVAVQSTTITVSY
jgi:hypothetical protein